MTKTERKVMEAFWNSHQQDRKYWHRDGVSAALRETINQLQKGTAVGAVIMCADVLELCEELEKL
jgi:hypothetical protein